MTASLPPAPICRLTGAFVATVLALIVAGCSQLAVLNASIPDDGFEASRDHAFGAHPRQKLDVYTPKARSGPAPVVVFFYGGSWQRGGRGDYKFVAEALTSKGLVVAIPDYRLYPEVRFPSFLEDGAAAVTWVQNHIGSYGGDPRQIYVMGHSAGAYNAAMLAFDPRYLKAAGGSSAQVVGFIGLAGPYDFLPLTSGGTLDKVFGAAPDPAATQPVNFVAIDSPRALVLYSERDTFVLPANSKRLAQRIHAVGGRVTSVGYPDLNHVEIVGVLAKPYQHRAPVLDDIDQFIAEGPTQFAHAPVDAARLHNSGGASPLRLQGDRE
jgi:acetyl esterase/lipase